VSDAPTRPDRAQAERLAARFGLDAPDAVRSIEAGHINESFEVRAGERAALLQWINPAVFPRAAAVQDNVERVLAHLRARAPELGTPALLPTVAGALRAEDASGLWRALEWLPDRRTLARPEDAADARAAGAALGRFLRALETVPPSDLEPVLAGFHDLDARLAALDAARADASADRLRAAAEALARVDAEREARRRGRAAGPLRVIHGDPKFTNFLFPAAGAAPPVLVDYDTLMPGRLAWDLGDFLRSAAATAAEDDPEAAGVDAALLAAGAEGVLGALGPGLADEDPEALADAPARMAFMLAVRFLTDHLAGDVYFRTRRPGQNLDRARAQLAVATAFDGRRDELVRVVSDAAR
jgi:Ser/Thr protein kinase RdoA (MazF antagonist)